MSNRMSSPSIKPDSGSKVLPGDKTGLPWEIWRIILSYLSAEDLCRSSCVCKTWSDLVLSLDSTRWRELYLHCTDWRHPFWPLNTDAEPSSWKQAFKDQYTSMRFWTKSFREPDTTNCFFALKRRKERKIIRVGRGMDHVTLKSALAVANPYDRIEVHPGIYDEQFEMSSKIPFEIIGHGELGSVILVVCIEQVAMTGRISNLVFRAPWFTNFILKVRSGYLQVDNCILEDGMVYVQNPGSCHLKYSTFRHATVILQHLNASIIENCEFSQTDSASITVEGYPREDKNWAYNYMAEKMNAVCNLRPSHHHKGSETAPTSAFSYSTTNQNPKSYDSKTDTVSSIYPGNGGRSLCSSAHFSTTQNDHLNFSLPSNGFNFQNQLSDMSKNCSVPKSNFDSKFEGNTECSRDVNKPTSCSHSKECSYLESSLTGSGSDSKSISADLYSSQGDIRTSCHLPRTKKPEDRYHETVVLGGIEPESDSLFTMNQNCAEPGTEPKIELPVNSVNCSEGKTEPTIEPGPSKVSVPEKTSKQETLERKRQNETDFDPSKSLPELLVHSLSVGRGQSITPSGASSSRSNTPISVVSGSDFFEEDDDVSDGYDSLSDNSSNQGDGHNSTSSSSDSMERLPISDSEDNFSSSEESVIMLSCPEHHQPRSISAAASVGSDVQSICSQNQSYHIKIVEDTAMRKVLNDVRGCLISRCRISQCKGGIMVSLQAHAIISQCDISGVGYGIRCIQNARVVCLKNEIHHCRTSGIFMRLASSGLIAGNDIHSNCEAGIDIRKNADPIVQSNRIHHGKRSGIVVLGSGRGQIKNNDIFQNKEAGVYILYRGNPYVSNNQIHSGKAAGIAINEGGRGYIVDNTVTGNQWGGVDIRHGGDPVISQNVICNGLSDGIVIGEKGRGSIENNVISGNAGCGVWITAACQPMIHGNQINNNGDAGVTFVNKMDAAHENDQLAIDRSEMHSQRSVEFWNFVNDEQSHPRRKCTRTTVEYNSIYHNNSKGIAVQYGEELLIQCNAVHGNRGNGISLDQILSVVVKDNSVTCNAGNGIITTASGKVNIQGNGVFDNRDYGIASLCEIVIEENDVVGNQRSALQLDKNSFLTVKRNRLQSLNDKVVVLNSIEGGHVLNNEIFTVHQEPIQVSKDCKCSVKDNRIISADPRSKNSETASCSKSSKDFCLLKDPPARPHIEAPPSIPVVPSNQISTVTRVTVPSDSTCEEGSKLCIIL